MKVTKKPSNVLHVKYREMTATLKSERHSLDNQIFVCPVCKSEGIFRSSHKAQQHISEFHQLPFGVVPQIRTLF